MLQITTPPRAQKRKSERSKNHRKPKYHRKPKPRVKSSKKKITRSHQQRQQPPQIPPKATNNTGNTTEIVDSRKAQSPNTGKSPRNRGRNRKNQNSREPQRRHFQGTKGDRRKRERQVRGMALIP